MPGPACRETSAKRPLRRVAVKEFALGVAGFGLQLLDFRIDVAVADQNVGPAVVVEIEEAAAPAEKLRVRAEAGGEGGVFEGAAAEIVIERRSVAGEIGFHEVEIAIEIIIGGGNAHARLRFAVGTEGAAGFDGDVLESSVLLVVVERAGGGIVGDIDIGPAVVVEVGGENAQAVGAVGAQDSRGLADVGKRAVAVIVVENILAALKAGRAAGTITPL